MTRILRLLMIAAVALPFFGNTAAAQEVARNGGTMPDVAIEKKFESGNVATAMTPENATNFEKLPVAITKVNAKAKAKVVPMTNEPKGTITVSQPIKVKQPSDVKTMKTRQGTSTHVMKAKGNVSLKAEDVPAGYALVIFNAEDVWGDGSGYQMLLDKDATMYASWSNNGLSQSIYNMADYMMPENADYDANGNATNFLIAQTEQVLVQAGTYDILIVNPTPGTGNYLASTNGNVGGRIDDYAFASGMVYEFTTSRSGNEDQTNVDIFSPNDPRTPTDLTARPDLATGTSADIDWTAGDNNEGWNLRYRPYVDLLDYNRSWTFPVSGGYVTSDWTLYDYDGDGNNWGYAATNSDQTDACLYSASWISGTGAVTPDNWAISPEVLLGGTLKFKARTNGYTEKLGVYVLSGNSLVQVGSDLTLGSSNTSFAEYSYDLSAFEGHGNIVIRHYNCSDGYRVFVDDIQVLVPSGNTTPPTELAWIYVSNVTNPYTINGLTPETTYEVQVQGVGNNTTSDWTSSELFTTHVVTVDPLDLVVAGEDLLNTIPPYSWTDDNGNTHSSSLTEIATDPNQMIAMIREIYTNKNLPGNLKRGFDANGGNNTPNQEVYYTGVGGIKLKDGATNYLSANSYEFDDIYGWGITGNIATPAKVTLNDAGDYAGYTDDVYYTHMQLNQYKPNDEGLTLLLVELKDTYVDGSNDAISADGTSYATESDRLKAYFQNTVRSIRVITGYKRTGEGVNSGTLFKIDCDKMNKFFLLAKGQLNLDHNTLDYFSRISWIDQNQNLDFCIAPVQMNFNQHDFFTDYNAGALFYHMFEQFSPVANDAQEGLVDIYQNLVNMDSFGVIHDCIGITMMNHQFMMYGVDSEDDDCQDVRDMMFFIPDYRMLNWNHRGTSSQEYHNYNISNQPRMGLFVIKQNPITGEQTAYNGNENNYKLHLTWTSNLLDFLPGEDGMYTLYRVTINPDGTKTYTAVDRFDPNTFEYYDNVPMQQTGQQVTYVVQGQDVEQFLDLQMSNEESYIIPGLDRTEQIRIELNSDYYFSRYDAADQTNNYSNSLIANNTVGTNVKPQYIVNGSQFKFWRATLDEQTGDVVTPDAPFVVAEVSNWNAATGGTLTYKDWNDQTNFGSKPYGHGYHANPTTSTISVANGEVVFDGLKLYDNFSVDVSENAHPTQYVYYVTLETAVPFPLNDAGTETSNQARSNTVSVPVYKTGMTMNPISATDVENDVTHETPATTKFDLNARYSSKSEILGYYIYRWASDETLTIYESNGDDSSPQGQAGNQGEYYTVAMNTDFTGRTENFASNHADVTASFEDNYMVNEAEEGDTYTYAPVVELFAPIQAVNLPSGVDRTDYNTYGGPQQMTAGGVVNVQVLKPEHSDYTWTANGKTYTYYNVFLDVTKLDLPAGYEVAKVRAWRKIDSQYLGEKAGGGYEGRLQLDANGEYKFIELASCAEGDELGNGTGDVLAGTFGAVTLSAGETIPMEFVVRVYFTKSVSGSKAADPNGDYYIAEYKISDELTSDIPTSIFGVESYRNVVSEKYINAAGVESDTPFQGVNIVVTRYDDGSTTTRKILK